MSARVAQDLYLRLLNSWASNSIGPQERRARRQGNESGLMGQGRERWTA
jgi:hypothetical protein